jgi:signal transduction histidine kinase
MRHIFLEKDNSGTVDNRMISTMRLVLGISALLIIYIDPFEPDRFVLITYATLILYVLYSAAIYFLITHQDNVFVRIVSRWSHWIDVAWYLFMISLSRGTSSVFSFKWGFLEGLKVTLAVAVLFTLVGYATSPSGNQFELDRFLLRPIYLTVLGYMMAYWGGYEVTLIRRLQLLKEISILSNPRFGVDRTIGIILAKLRDFYQASSCMLILQDTKSGEYSLRHIDSSDMEAGVQPQPVNQQMIRSFLKLPPEQAVLYKAAEQNGSLNKRTKYYAIDLSTGERSTEWHEASESLVEQFDACCFITVPVYLRKEVLGRLYVISENRKSFVNSDIEFLLQALDQFMPVVENIQLVDRLATSAAEEERKRIARDIHDSIIQPYIGLQLGLDSLSQMLDSDSGETKNNYSERQNLVIKRVDRLRELTQKGIADLRRYVRGLTETGKTESGLSYSLRRYADKFGEATGIKVNVRIDDKIIVADRLSAEVFQIFVEGLSNIRRHTQSSYANIKLGYSDNMLVINIENETDKADGFVPRSITERVKSLGGVINIQQLDGTTNVKVEIPL